MIFSYILIGVLAIVIVNIYLDKNSNSKKDLGFYWIVSIFLALGAEVLGYRELAYIFAGAALFLWFLGDKLQFKK